MKKIFFMSILTVFFLSLGFSNPVFSNDIQVNDDSLNFQGIAAEKTTVIVQNGCVYTAWQDTRNFTDEAEGAEFRKSDVYFAKYAIDGEGNLSGGTNVMVNDLPGMVIRDEGSRPAMAVNSSGEIFIVWCDARNIENQLSGNDIYLAKSTDGGASFQSNIKISPDEGSSTNPVIAVSGVNVFVSYEFCCTPANDVLKLSISRDSGASFLPCVTLAETGLAAEPSIAVDGNFVYLAYKSWYEEHSGEIMLLKSMDSGATFSSSVKINTNGMGSAQDSVAVAASGDNVYMVWRDTSDAFTEASSGTIVLAVSRDGGSTFPVMSSIVPDSRAASRPGLSAYLDNVAVSYTSSGDDVYGNLLYSRISRDAGATWSDEIIVSDQVVDRPDVGPSSISINAFHSCTLWNDGMGSSQNIDVYLDCYTFEQQEPPEECLPGLTLVSAEFNGCTMELTVEYMGQSLCLVYELNINTLGFEFVNFCTD